MQEARIEEIEREVEERLAQANPAVELLACESPGNESLRIVIDSEQGVDLELCEQVTGLFPDLLEEFSLEVSSPGPERPLRTRKHFAECQGERIRLRTSEPVDGSRTFVGVLAASEQDSLLIATEQGAEVRVEYGIIARANLAPSSEQGGTGSEEIEAAESEVNA